MVKKANLEKKPLITITGTGPGDPELISYKGIKAIAEADVIVYDKFINVEILNYARPECYKVELNKNEYGCNYLQCEINKKLVDLARKYGHLVRLKPGDPLIFEKGYEEITYAESQGIKTEIIPGISTTTGIAAAEKIPLTLYGIYESVWTISGKSDAEIFNEEIKLAAQSRATVVINMGMHRLQQIIKIYKMFGKSNQTVSIIQNTSMLTINKGIGTINTIDKIVKEKELSDPAVIIIGNTVNSNLLLP
jgi:uroporphyrin-III C-methyltransferase